MTSSNGNIFRLLFCLICAWTNGWVNNRDAGDLRRHRAHYDITVMGDDDDDDDDDGGDDDDELHDTC